MSARESRKAQKENTTELTGLVIMRKFAEGSKSEHDSVCLKTLEGTFVLRRVGGNPFNDNVLNELVGKRITSYGRIDGPYFMMTDFREC